MYAIAFFLCILLESEYSIVIFFLRKMQNLSSKFYQIYFSLSITFNLVL